jgi:hypothetical protein
LCDSIYIYIYIYIHTHTHTHTHVLSLSLSLSLYIYIYIYVPYAYWIQMLDDLRSVSNASDKVTTLLQTIYYWIQTQDGMRSVSKALRCPWSCPLRCLWTNTQTIPLDPPLWIVPNTTLSPPPSPPPLHTVTLAGYSGKTKHRPLQTPV